MHLLNLDEHLRIHRSFLKLDHRLGVIHVGVANAIRLLVLVHIRYIASTAWRTVLLGARYHTTSYSSSTIIGDRLVVAAIFLTPCTIYLR